MPMETSLADVVKGQDGPWTVYDAVVTAKDIHDLFRTGILRVDPDKQRGKDNVTGKEMVDTKKVETWTDELIKGTAIFGQLSWNFRLEESKLEYEAESKKLIVRQGRITIPDSAHRHRAILAAVDSASRGSGFDVNRQFSVRIFNVTTEEEARIFFAFNQEGRPADATRSKWLYPKLTTQRLAKDLVELSPHLTNENVDTVRDRLSRRNPRLAAFNTISKAVESYWGTVNLADGKFDGVRDWLLRYWDALVEVLPALKKMDLNKRQEMRASSLADSGVAIHGFIKLARAMYESGTPLSALKRLADTIDGPGGRKVEFLSRANPEWQRRGILIPYVKKSGESELSLRNARQSFDAMAAAFAERVGIAPEIASIAADITKVEQKLVRLKAEAETPIVKPVRTGK